MPQPEVPTPRTKEAMDVMREACAKYMVQHVDQNDVGLYVMSRSKDYCQHTENAVVDKMLATYPSSRALPSRKLLKNDIHVHLSRKNREKCTRRRRKEALQWLRVFGKAYHEQHRYPTDVEVEAEAAGPPAHGTNGGDVHSGGGSGDVQDGGGSGDVQDGGGSGDVQDGGGSGDMPGDGGSGGVPGGGGSGGVPTALESGSTHEDTAPTRPQQLPRGRARASAEPAAPSTQLQRRKRRRGLPSTSRAGGSGSTHEDSAPTRLQQPTVTTVGAVAATTPLPGGGGSGDVPSGGGSGDVPSGGGSGNMPGGGGSGPVPIALGSGSTHDDSAPTRLQQPPRGQARASAEPAAPSTQQQRRVPQRGLPSTPRAGGSGSTHEDSACDAVPATSARVLLALIREVQPAPEFQAFRASLDPLPPNQQLQHLQAKVAHMLPYSKRRDTLLSLLDRLWDPQYGTLVKSRLLDDWNPSQVLNCLQENLKKYLPNTS